MVSAPLLPVYGQYSHAWPAPLGPIQRPPVLVNCKPAARAADVAPSVRLAVRVVDHDRSVAAPAVRLVQGKYVGSV